MMSGQTSDRSGARTGNPALGASVAFLDVAKQYGDVWALEKTTLEVAPGEFFAILGPSGSGKSTLLGIAAGYVTPTSGRLLLNGEDILGRPPYRRNIGMVFQNYALFPHMTVAENVSFPLRMRRMNRSETELRTRRMLEVVRLTGFEDRRPAQLSGGQQQRVALARAAVYDPLLLLMDEPLGALDKNLREAVQDEIKRFQRELSATVIYVTHDQQEAAALADRIAIMRAGRIVQIGTPRELYESPGSLFVASFLGEANVLPVARQDVADGSTRLLTTAGGLAVRAQPSNIVEDAAVACVRPERVFLADATRSFANQFDVEVVEVVYAVGSYRYRLRLPDDSVIAWRPRSGDDRVTYQPGDRMRIGWDIADTLVLPAE